MNNLAGRKSDRGRRPEKEWRIIGIAFPGTDYNPGLYNRVTDLESRGRKFRTATMRRNK